MAITWPSEGAAPGLGPFSWQVLFRNPKNGGIEATIYMLDFNNIWDSTIKNLTFLDIGDGSPGMLRGCIRVKIVFKNIRFGDSNYGFDN